MAPELTRRPSYHSNLEIDDPHDTQPGDQNNFQGQQRPLVSWDDTLRLQTPATWTETDQPGKSRSLASYSSVVDDLGNAKYLADNRTSSYAISNGVSETSTRERSETWHTIAHTGSAPALTRNTHSLGRQEIETAGFGEALSEESDIGQVEDLGISLRAAFQQSASVGKEKFLPNNALESIVTKERVRRELHRSKLDTSENLDLLTDQVWEVTSSSPLKSPGKQTTRVKIFAILALIAEIPAIIDFIDAELHDNDLPFILSDGGVTQFRRNGKDGRRDPIQLFDKWVPHQRDAFSSFQRKFTAPYFQLSTETNQRPQHYTLEGNEIVLPFVEDDEHKFGAGNAEGGYGRVWRVKIHPAHHNCCDISARQEDNPSYAIKRLHHNSEKKFRMEVSNLKRFSQRPHLHLIKLLVTFEFRGQFHLVFPWADGNLLGFWKEHPEPRSREKDHKKAIWFSEQCLGIVQGLNMIHKADIPTRDAEEDTSYHQTHGRHGDLKPENILWFMSYNSCQLPVLVISDFGLTRFHRTQSKSHIENVGVSRTYRAPEYDIANMVSQGYDIWALGCLLLEFVTWYVLGWKEVDEFSKARTSEDTATIPEDVFFQFVRMGDDIWARAKQTVADELSTLYNSTDCSDFMCELLVFIENNLLRIDPRKRATCEVIVERFSNLHKECLRDKVYCTERLKNPPRRSSTSLSEISASALKLSSAMQGRLNLDGIPEYTGPLENKHHPKPETLAESSGAEKHPSTQNRDTLPQAVSHHFDPGLKPERQEMVTKKRQSISVAIPRRSSILKSPTTDSVLQPPQKAVQFLQGKQTSIASNDTESKLEDSAVRPQTDNGIQVQTEGRSESRYCLDSGVQPREPSIASTDPSLVPPPRSPSATSISGEITEMSSNAAITSEYQPALPNAIVATGPSLAADETPMGTSWGGSSGEALQHKPPMENGQGSGTREDNGNVEVVGSSLDEENTRKAFTSKFPFKTKRLFKGMKGLMSALCCFSNTG